MSNLPARPLDENPASLGTPAELVAALPYLLGFPPRESVVAVGLDADHVVCLTLRLDLPASRSEQVLAERVAGHLGNAGSRAAVVVIVTETPSTDGRLPRMSLIRALRTRLDRAGIGLQDALCVRSGRWWSYVCADPLCCPPGGRTVEPEPPGAFVAAMVAGGRAVQSDRADLVAALTSVRAAADVTWQALIAAAEHRLHAALQTAEHPIPADADAVPWPSADADAAEVRRPNADADAADVPRPGPDAVEHPTPADADAADVSRLSADADAAHGQRLRATPTPTPTAPAADAERRRGDSGAVRDAVIAQVEAALAARTESVQVLTDRQAADFCVALGVTSVRDACVRWMGGPFADQAESLWLDLVRAAPETHVAPPATLLAFYAYARGDGTFARICVDRALAASPGYAMAELLRNCVDAGVGPALIRELAGCVEVCGGDR